MDKDGVEWNFLQSQPPHTPTKENRFERHPEDARGVFWLCSRSFCFVTSSRTHSPQEMNRTQGERAFTSFEDGTDKLRMVNRKRLDRSDFKVAFLA